MKIIRRILSVLFVVTMLIGSGVTTFAGDDGTTYTIKINQNNDDKGTHTYEAYQVFKGDLALSGTDKILSNVTWGTGINENNLLAALKGDVEEFKKEKVSPITKPGASINEGAWL